MKTRTSARVSIILISAIGAFIIISCWNQHLTVPADSFNNFETIRAHIQAWLSKTSISDLLISSSFLKEKIVDDWSNQRDKYQIVSVRKPDDYNKAGHIRYATNIYWIDIVNDESLALLDPDKTIILYCYYGLGSMITTTILSQLGYECRSLNYGMMGWNMDALVKEPWDKKADHEVEVTANEAIEAYPLPVITSSQSDAANIIKEMARKYFSGKGSPVIISSDVKAIVDDWDHKKAEYRIVDVRSEKDYKTGHIPHSINIPWANIAEINNLKKLDPNRTTIVYSENGQTGQLATTVLSLLGYRAVNSKFGMMDWNDRYVDRSELWTGAADYPVEH